MQLNTTKFDRNMVNTFVISKGNMSFGGYHASGSSTMYNNNEVKAISRK